MSARTPPRWRGSRVFYTCRRDYNSHERFTCTLFISSNLLLDQNYHGNAASILRAR